MSGADPDRGSFTLNRRIMLVVVFALLPISLFSLNSAYRMREHVNALAGARLIASANATASTQREAINMARRMLVRLAMNADVAQGRPDCSREINAQLVGQQAVVNLARSDAAGRLVCSGLPTARRSALPTNPGGKMAKKTDK